MQLGGIIKGWGGWGRGDGPAGTTGSEADVTDVHARAGKCGYKGPRRHAVQSEDQSGFRGEGVGGILGGRNEAASCLRLGTAGTERPR